MSMNKVNISLTVNGLVVGAFYMYKSSPYIWNRTTCMVSSIAYMKKNTFGTAHMILIMIDLNYLLPTAYEALGKVMFSQASVTLFTRGGVCLPTMPWGGQTPTPRPGGRPSWEDRPTAPTPRRRSTGGRYASYWNAYLFNVNKFGSLPD